MKMKATRARRWWALSLLAASALLSVATLACSGNPNVSVGGSVHRSSGGRWGHSISVGVHSNGRR